MEHSGPLALQILIIAAMILALIRVRHQLSLCPLYVALGVMQPIQAMLAASIYVEVSPGILVSPGSVAMFAGSLFALLLVYILEDAREARKVVYALVLSNLVLVALYQLIAQQIASGAVSNELGLPEQLFRIKGRVMAVGTVVLFADALLIILLYEGLGRHLRKRLFVRAWLTLTIVLAFDTVLFTCGAFFGAGEIAPLILGGLVGKSAAAVVYAGALYAYLRWIEPRGSTDPAPLRDLFETLTYREKYEYQRSEAVRSKQEHQFLQDAILQAAVEGLLVVGADGTILKLNPAAERLLGDGCGAQGNTIDKCLRPPGALEGLRNEARQRENSEPCESTELCLVRADGSKLPVEVAVGTTTVGGKEVFVIVMRDISERIANEEHLRQSERLDAIGGVAAGVAHDFNNILTAISGANSMAPGGSDSHERLVIDDAVARAASLTRQLLVMSRHEVQDPHHVNLVTIVSNLRGLLSRLIREDIEFSLVANVDEAVVFADRSEIDQVIMNLVVNAVYSMPTGGRLSVTLDVVAGEVAELIAGNYASIEVRDTGCGMDDEAIERAFEPFYTTKPAGQGTGLGLATIRRIVDSLQGRVDIESVLGEGTRLRVLLPLSGEPEEGGARNEALPSAEATGRPLKVLVCDDDPLVARIATRLLDGDEFETHRVSSPREALRWIRENGESLDVLVSDLVMPEMNGRELAAAAREIRSGLRVVHISGYVDEPTRAGPECDPIVPKPFRREALRSAIFATSPAVAGK